MNDLNSLLIAGTVAHEPERRWTTKDIATCSFTVVNVRKGAAVHVDVKTSGFDLMDGVLANEICRDVHKGSHVLVRGYLTQDRWVDPEGNDKSRTYIMAERVESQGEVRDADASV